MATRGKTTFLKRQKEMARKEKQQMKAARRAQRKLEPLVSDEIADRSDGDDTPHSTVQTKNMSPDPAMTR